MNQSPARNRKRIPDAEATAYPWWAIINPRQNMALGDRGVQAVADMVAGPFFDRAEAQAALDEAPHRYSRHAKVYCMSGHRSPSWKAFCNEERPVDGPLSPADMLKLAASLSEDLVSRMAHAVGWPKPYEIRNAKKRLELSAKEPYRNHYTGHPGDVWQAGVEAGVVAITGRDTPSAEGVLTTYTVTPAGLCALRLRLGAEILTAAVKL